MKKLMTDWQFHLYNGRFKIEFDFLSLKDAHGLVISLAPINLHLFAGARERMRC